MLKKWSVIFIMLALGRFANAQTNPVDTSIAPVTDLFLMDSTIDYEELFKDLDSFLDSLLTPRSYFLVGASVGKGNYSFESKSSGFYESEPRFTYSPQLAYYHKSGLGLSSTGYIVNDDPGMNLYQFSVTPSFDYIKDRRLVTGISYTRFKTKDSLDFYTTPIQNELYAYFTYRKTWLRPTVALSYGWGTRKDYKERETQILDLRLRRRGYTYINTEESISDFSVLASLRHDFYWLDVLANKDHIRLTPQLSFTSGTQKFGFNQSSGSYVTVLRTGNNVLYNTDNVYLDDEIKFQPLSLTFYLRGEYSIGKFFVQPQVIFDYYFPATENNFGTLFSVNAGFIF